MPAQLLRDVVVLTCEAIGAYVIGRWAWQQITAAGRDALESIHRHHAHRDALARATRPRSIP